MYSICIVLQSALNFASKENDNLVTRNPLLVRIKSLWTLLKKDIQKERKPLVL